MISIGVVLLFAGSMGPSESAHILQGHKDVCAVSPDRSGSSPTTEHGRAKGIEPTLIEANPEHGLEHPYYLYAPEHLGEAPTPILMEPNNTHGPALR